MRQRIIRFLIVAVIPFTAAILSPQEARASKPTAEGKSEDQLMQRIDFGNSYIMGQTIKSGAVYLLQRKKSDIKSMLKVREDYREEILEDVTIENGEKDNEGKPEQDD